MCFFTPALFLAEGAVASEAALAAAEAAALSANVSLGSTLLGTGLSAVGQYQQGQAAKAQAEFQAGVARNNQIVAERQADDALERGRLAEQQKRLQIAQLGGRQRASFAASGVALDEGSPLDILGDTAAFGAYDLLSIRSNAGREAYGYRQKAADFGTEAGLLSASGRAQAQGGLLDAGKTLLGGAGSFADKWYRFKRS